jgi:predicted nucleic acid-binding protein
MIAIDTNILIRLLVDDKGQPEQVEAAWKQVKKEGAVFIPQIVQVETVWVLESAYNTVAQADISCTGASGQQCSIHIAEQIEFSEGNESVHSG